MPYANEHAARLHDPRKYDEFRRENDAGGPGVDFIYGIWTEDGERKSEIQAIRFDAKKFTPSEAKKWLKDHDYDPIEFEEATGEDEGRRSLDPALAPLRFRSAALAPSSWRPETREVDVILSTGAAALMRDRATGEEYLETLAVEPGAVDTTLVDAGVAPVLADHGERAATLFGLTDPVPTVRTIVGRIKERSVRYEQGQVVATAVLTTADDARPVIQRILDGTLRAASIGYRPLEWSDREEGGRKARHVSRWLLAEQSFVAIPADAGARIRSQEVQIMSDRIETPDLEAAKKEAAREEARRQTAIRSLCQRHGIDLSAEPRPDDPEPLLRIRAALEDPTQTLQAVQSHVLDLLAARSESTRVRAPARVIVDESENLRRGLEALLEYRAGLRSDLPDEARPYAADTWLDIGRRMLEAGGDRGVYLGRASLARAVLHQRAAHVTADFPHLTANLMGKVLAAERAMSPEYEWFRRVASRTDLPDYKDRTVVDFGGLGRLPVVPEGAEFSRATFGDEKIAWHLLKYGREVALTEELLVNDDLGGFLRLVRMFVRAALVTQSAVAAEGIVSNPIMGDGHALFSVAHNNLSSSPGAPTVARLAEGDNALRDMVDRDGARVGRPARLLISPTTHRTVLEQLYSDHYAPTTATEALTVPIAREDRLYPPPFDGTAWYLHTGDTLSAEYGYLQGEGGPVVSDYAEEQVEARVYHCRLVFGFRVIDWRAWFCNAGA